MGSYSLSSARASRQALHGQKKAFAASPAARAFPETAAGPIDEPTHVEARTNETSHSDEVIEATIEEDPATVDGDAPPLIRPRLHDN